MWRNVEKEKQVPTFNLKTMRCQCFYFLNYATAHLTYRNVFIRVGLLHDMDIRLIQLPSLVHG